MPLSPAQAANAKARNFGYTVPKPKKPVPPIVPYFSHGLGVTAPAASGIGRDAPYAGVPGYVPPTTVPAVTPPAARPDFKGYVTQGIPGDWEVGAATTAMGERMAALRSAFTGDIRGALVNLGLPEDAGIGKEFGSYIDQDTITKAIGNKYSTAAQVATQARKQQANTSAALAARGMLRSGASTNRAATIQAQAEQQRYQAIQDFLSGARGGLRGLGEAESGLARDLATARSNAAARLAQQYGYEYPEEQAAAEPTAPATVVTPPPQAESAAARRARLAEEALHRRSVDANAYYRRLGLR